MFDAQRTPPGGGLLAIRPEISASWLRILGRERPMNPSGVDRLTDRIRAGEPIDITQPFRLVGEYAADGVSTVADYLSGCIRDHSEQSLHADFEEFVALGALALDLETAAG